MIYDCQSIKETILYRGDTIKRKPTRTCKVCGKTFEIGGEPCDPDCPEGKFRLKQRKRYHAQVLKTGRLNQNHLQKTYKLTDEAYEFLLLVQNYRCAICKRPEAEIEDRRVGRPRDDKSTSAKKLRKLVVDHDHATGEIRGLLCHYCNIGLGSFWDSPERLKNAAFYLQNHQTVQQMQGKQGEKSDGEL